MILSMGTTEKKINKWLLGAIIGGAVIGASALSATKKGQSFWQKIFSKAKSLVDSAMQHGESLGKKVGGTPKKNNSME